MGLLASEDLLVGGGGGTTCCRHTPTPDLSLSLLFTTGQIRLSQVHASELSLTYSPLYHSLPLLSHTSYLSSTPCTLMFSILWCLCVSLFSHYLSLHLYVFLPSFYVLFFSNPLLRLLTFSFFLRLPAFSYFLPYL